MKDHHCPFPRKLFVVFPPPPLVPPSPLSHRDSPYRSSDLLLCSSLPQLPRLDRTPLESSQTPLQSFHRSSLALPLQQYRKTRVQCHSLLHHRNPRLQRQEHPFHRPILPLVQQTPPDSQLPANLSGFAPLRHYREHPPALLFRRMTRTLPLSLVLYPRPLHLRLLHLFHLSPPFRFLWR